MNKDNKITSFVFHKSWYDGFICLPLEERSEYIRMICDYAFNPKEFNEKEYLSRILPMFAMTKPQIDSDRECYERKIQSKSIAGSHHRGNQYTRKKENGDMSKNNEVEQNGTNGTESQIVEQNGTNGTESQIVEQNGTNGTLNYSYNYCVNLNSNSLSLKEREKEKEEVILNTAIYFFKKGCKSPFDEAKTAYEYNESRQWETVCVNKKKGSSITYSHAEQKEAYLQGWPLKKAQKLAVNDCQAFYRSISAVIETQKDFSVELINNFRGFHDIGRTICIKYIKCDAYVRLINSETPDYSDVKSLMIKEFQSMNSPYNECRELSFKDIVVDF